MLQSDEAFRVPPSKQAHCEKCHAGLSYEVGSIAWQCAGRDLCPSCEGEEAAKRIVDAMREAFTTGAAR